MKQERLYYVYIMANQGHSVLYTGITNNLQRRVNEHKAHSGSVFTSRYNMESLVYYEEYQDSYTAIAREKQIKAGPRKKKEALIEAANPTWRDLSEDF